MKGSDGAWHVEALSKVSYYQDVHDDGLSSSLGVCAL